MKPQFLIPTVLSGGQSYIQKVLGIEVANLIGYYPMNETSGTTADNLEGTAARDGTYARDVSTMGTGTGIGDGNMAPDFDGTQDYVSFPAGLKNAFNTAEGTISVWAKVSGAGVWEDAGNRIISLIREAGGDYIYIRKTATNNRLEYERVDDTKTSEVLLNGISSTAWMHFAFTWSESGDAVKAFYNGSQTGATVTGLGSFAQAPNVAQLSKWTTATQYWDGYLAHLAVWTKALSDAQILSLATV